MEIADAFLHFDRRALEVCEYFFNQIREGALNASEPDAVPDAIAKLREIGFIDEELLSIENGVVNFHENILRNQTLITYAAKGMSLLSKMLRSPSMHASVRATFDGMIRQVIDVPPMISRAALDGFLDIKTRVALRQRWIAIKRVCNFMESQAMLAPDILIPSW